MKIGFTLWVVILLAVLCSQPTAAYAQTRQYHDTIYTLPDQWVSGAVRADYIDLFQKGHHKQIELMATIDIPESETKLLEWMNAKLEESIFSYDRDSIGSPKSDIVTKHGQVTERFSFVTSNSDLRIAYLHTGTKYANLLIFEANRSYTQSALSQLEDHYADTFLPLCQNLKFVSQGAKPLLGKPTPGELEGVYFHDTPVINHFLSSHSGEVLVFSKSGHFFAGLPRSTSAERISFERALKYQPASSGNYVIKGNKISFDFANGFSRIVDFKQAKDGFILEMGSEFQAVIALKNGKRLNGIWENYGNQMYDANEMMRGDMGRPKKIEFTADGQYRATQFYGFEKDASGKLNDVAGRLKPTNGEAASSGSYVIKDGTIEFTNGSGRVTELNIVYINDSAMVVGGRRYERRNTRK